MKVGEAAIRSPVTIPLRGKNVNVLFFRRSHKKRIIWKGEEQNNNGCGQEWILNSGERGITRGKRAYYETSNR